MAVNRPLSYRRTALLYLSPWIITLLLFWLYPLAYSFYLSLTDYELLGRTINFVGFANYRNLFMDSDFLKALFNTLIFVVGTIPFTTLFALALALLVNRKIPGARFFRSGYFIPSITSLVVIALIFTNLYSRGGYLTMLCDLVGIPTPERGFLFSESTALFAIMAMDIWIASGYYMLLFLAALKSIPQEHYEAAAIDGASSWSSFIRITLPQLRPMALYIILINTIKSFQVFVEIFVMTKGGPLNSTLTAVYFVYDRGLHRFDMGYASAAAYILFVLIMIFALIQMRLFRAGRSTAE
ncbi:MAG: sugar ABC transporter permease [Candidatus Zixiibacteriota bacterium]